MEVLSATALRAIPGNQPFAGLTGLCRPQDDRYAGPPSGQAGEIAALFRIWAAGAIRREYGDRSAQHLAVLHGHSAGPKMVDTRDVTPSGAPVDISVKDLLITEPPTGSDLTVRRFLREHAMNSHAGKRSRA